MNQEEANERAKKQRDDAIKPEEKNDGGHVYPRERRYGQPAGITRRNKLIDDLVVGMVAGEYARPDEGAENPVEFLSRMKKDFPRIACDIADAVIAESNK